MQKLSTEIPVDTIYSNYSSAYVAWNNSYEEECPECRGTGLDRDEIYDCEYCYGEGVIVFEGDEPDTEIALDTAG